MITDRILLLKKHVLAAARLPADNTLYTRGDQ